MGRHSTGRHRKATPAATHLLRGGMTVAGLALGAAILGNPTVVVAGTASAADPTSTDPPVPPTRISTPTTTPTSTATVDKEGMPVEAPTTSGRRAAARSSAATTTPAPAGDPTTATAAGAAARSAATRSTVDTPSPSAATSRPTSTPSERSAVDTPSATSSTTTTVRPTPTPSRQPAAVPTTPSTTRSTTPSTTRPSATTPTTSTKTPAPPVSTTLAARIVTNAVSIANGPRVPYVWGGKSTRGFDCSGFVWEVLKRSGMSVPYRNSDGLKAWATPVPRGSERPGDLAFYPGHVGIVVAPGMIADASNSVNDVSVRPYWAAFTFGRVRT